VTQDAIRAPSLLFSPSSSKLAPAGSIITINLANPFSSCAASRKLDRSCYSTNTISIWYRPLSGWQRPICSGGRIIYFNLHALTPWTYLPWGPSIIKSICCGKHVLSEICISFTLAQLRSMDQVSKIGGKSKEETDHDPSGSCPDVPLIDTALYTAD